MRHALLSCCCEQELLHIHSLSYAVLRHPQLMFHQVQYSTGKRYYKKSHIQQRSNAERKINNRND